jgi:formate dehydrogenase iron-sulfur subunit
MVAPTKPAGRPKAMLIDTTRCIGCRGCQVACKQWNHKPGEVDAKFLPAQKDRAEQFARAGYQNPPDLDANTWTLITYNEVDIGGRFHWVFGKLQCMHCQHPACVSACPVQALEKLDSGPVIHHADRCIGCRYCMLACPFQVPKFEWHKALPVIQKCTMCSDRLATTGIYSEPACSKVCPTDAVVTGDRDELVAEAWRRIDQAPNRYLAHVYGEHEVGGTCVLHLSNVPFDQIGYRPDLPNRPLGDFTKLAMGGIPYVVSALLVVLGSVYAVRRHQVSRSEQPTGREGKYHG